MARSARCEVFEAEEVGVYHVYNRVVRRCFLWGTDPLTGTDFSYRREMVVERLRLLTKYFAIDILAYAVLSNHFHLVVRNRPDLVDRLSDREVARRWLMICPAKRNPDSTPIEPTESELKMVLNDRNKLKELRGRLSNPSWLMGRACQYIARRCNDEDQQSGRFFEERFKMKRLLDEGAVLACLAYVDLNPHRAGVSDHVGDYEAVSISERLRKLDDSDASPEEWLVPFSRATVQDCSTRGLQAQDSQPIDQSLSEASEKIAPTAEHLPFDFEAYCKLLRWLTENGKSRGDDVSVNHRVDRMLCQFGFAIPAFVEAVDAYERQFRTVVGCSAAAKRESDRRGRRHLHVPGRHLLSSSRGQPVH